MTTIALINFFIVFLAISLIIAGMIFYNKKENLLYLISIPIGIILIICIQEPKIIPIEHIKDNIYYCVKNYKNDYFDENSSKFICEKKISYVKVR